ncbi:hypothetical protein JCM15831A_23240 [Asaia astilbis]
MSISLLKHPRRRIALATLLVSSLAISAPLHAAPQVVDAEDLDLSVPCLGRFEITVDPAMSDGVSIDSSPTGGAHLTMRTGKTQGSSKVLISSKSCAPSAKVSILVAPTVGVLIHDSHDTHIVIHGTLASLEASLEAGQLDADTIQSLDLSLRGTEQVHIAHLNRAAQVVETGASGLVVDQADLDAFSAQLSETSHLAVTDGRFDVLTLMVENAASVRLGGSVNTATVSANGTGLVSIPTVSGALTRSGSVQVGPTPPAAPPMAVAQPVAPQPTPPTPPVAQPPSTPSAAVKAPPALPSAPLAPTAPSAPTKPVTSSTLPPVATEPNAASGKTVTHVTTSEPASVQEAPSALPRNSPVTPAPATPTMSAPVSDAPVPPPAPGEPAQSQEPAVTVPEPQSMPVTPSKTPAPEKTTAPTAKPVTRPSTAPSESNTPASSPAEVAPSASPAQAAKGEQPR